MIFSLVTFIHKINLKSFKESLFHIHFFVSWRYFYYLNGQGSLSCRPLPYRYYKENASHLQCHFKQIETCVTYQHEYNFADTLHHKWYIDTVSLHFIAIFKNLNLAHRWASVQEFLIYKMQLLLNPNNSTITLIWIKFFTPT